MARQPTTSALLALLLSTTPLATACDDGNSASPDGGGTAGPPTGSGSHVDAGDHDVEAGSDAGGGADAGGEGGGTCDLADSPSCNFDCGADCAVECLGAICATDCPEGGCRMDTDFGAHATLDCAGGGCKADCDNGSACEIDCPAGGCVVVCDVDSTCSVTCAESGTPCSVSCENGGRATCEGNCDVTNCENTCIPDDTYMPEIDPEKFTTVIDNPLLPLAVGSKWVYESADEKVTVTVTDMTYTTAIGVAAIVVHDEVRSIDTDELLEDTFDWYAQDDEGNVWYMGEDTAEYFHGEVTTTAGTWEAGVDGAQPGIVMHAMAPDVSTKYRQEYKACEAEDFGEIYELDASETVTAGSYDNCIRTRDNSPLEPNVNEIKTYCPDVGQVLESDEATGERLEELVDYTTK